jgi:hypothetical protein
LTPRGPQARIRCVAEDGNDRESDGETGVATASLEDIMNQQVSFDTPPVEPAPLSVPPPAAAAPDVEDWSWLDSEAYAFPGLKGLYAEKEEELKRHAEAMTDLDRRIHDMMTTEQEAFHNLLRAEGSALKAAVLHSLRYLGWGRVVDVDDYWKKVIRSKEEDIWLIDSEDQHVEVSMRKDPLILVLVRSGKAWTTDDECLLLQKFKGRRMQEFDNTKMKALLVGNYFCRTEAGSRGNPFSPLQIEEAQKDGNGLLTTYELFRAVKAEKEGRARKEELRCELREKTGLIEFEF